MLNYTRKTLVRFYFEGIGEETREVGTRELSKISIPENAHAFLFYDILSATVMVGGKKVELESGPIERSPKCYYGGEVFTAEELAKRFPELPYLLEKIEGTNRRAIKFRDGEWDIIWEEDLHIAAM